jgi:hypothetical protein
MLYAERMLMRLDSIGRQGAVLAELSKPVPADLNGLYRNMLDECYRRTPEAQRSAVSALFAWLTYSERPLTLAEVVSLLRYITGDDDFELDEIPEPFTTFVRIEDAGIDAEVKAQIEARGGWDTTVKELDEMRKNGSDKDQIYNDASLPVKFQERSMRSFFADGMVNNNDPTLRPDSQEAHRRIFLVCTHIVRVPPRGSSGKFNIGLIAYASRNLMHHLSCIAATTEHHSEVETAEILNAIGGVVSNQYNFVILMGRFQLKFDVEPWATTVPALISKWATVWTQFKTQSNAGIQSHIDPIVVKWWDEVADDIRLVYLRLARGHISQLYDANNLPFALASYVAARTALEVVSRLSRSE